MALDEADRHELYQRLEEAIGRGPTATIMTLLPHAGWDDVARTRDLDLLRAELRAEIAGVRTEVAELRSDVADALRSQTMTLLAAMVTISGLTVAAAGLL